jgi:glycosyltransferase involved in cell wall biosynthesis
MKIAIDARELLGRPTGVGRYLAELLACWSRQPSASAHTLQLFADQAITLPNGLIGSGGATMSTHVVPGARGVRGVLWEQLSFRRAVRDADVVFGPAYSGPLFGRPPLVVAMHDVSFYAHPEWFGAREGRRRRWLARASARRARVLMTISAFSKEEIVRRLGVPAEKIVVTPLSAGGWFGSTGVMSGEMAGEREPIVLYVGSIFSRRNVPLLMRAFAGVRDIPHARLVIVGENRTSPRDDLEGLAQALGIADRVSIRSYVSDDELAALYRRAAAFAFLSTYEGFGLTPLEALAAGVPIVVCDTPVAREVYGDAALYVRDGDTNAVTLALSTLLGDTTTRSQLATRAAAVLARYSWDRTAIATLHAITSAAR